MIRRKGEGGILEQEHSSASDGSMNNPSALHQASSALMAKENISKSSLSLKARPPAQRPDSKACQCY